MSVNKNQVIFFAGKKMTIEEFIVLYGMENESEKSIEIVLNKLEKKGKLRFLNESESEDSAFQAVAKELDLEAKLAQIEEDADRTEAYKIQKAKEGKLVYEEVEIDFPTFNYAEEFREYAEKSLRLQAHIQEGDGVYVLVLKNVSESDLSAIKRRKGLAEAGKVFFRTTDKVAESALSATAFATEKVIVPTTKATIKTSLGLAKNLVKTSAQVGSSLITSTTQSARSMSAELAHDEDVLRAKKDLVDAKDAIMRLFKRGNRNSGMRIK